MPAGVMDSKPRLRGVLHQFATALALGAGLVLIGMAPSRRAGAAAALFALSLVVLFAVSATYHSVDWSARVRAWLRRLDHAAIFLLIAGTYTPIAVVGLPDAGGGTLLLAIWVGALAGMLQSLFWAGAPKWVTAALAVALGWTIVPWLGEAYRALGLLPLALIAAGGVAYTVGAVAYVVRGPNPRPGIFGYHEVFHALTILGAVLHFAAVVLIVRAA